MLISIVDPTLRSLFFFKPPLFLYIYTDEVVERRAGVARDERRGITGLYRGYARANGDWECPIWPVVISRLGSSKSWLRQPFFDVYPAAAPPHRCPLAHIKLLQVLAREGHGAFFLSRQPLPRESERPGEVWVAQSFSGPAL